MKSKLTWTVGWSVSLRRVKEGSLTLSLLSTQHSTGAPGHQDAEVAPDIFQCCKNLSEGGHNLLLIITDMKKNENENSTLHHNTYPESDDGS